MRQLCDIIKETVIPNFMNIRTSLRTYDRDALCCGAPCWRWAYHAIHSADKWFINPNDYSFKLLFCEDVIKDKGPMPGIMTGLGKVNGDYALVLPCDSPYVSADYINTIFSEIDEGCQAVVPCHDLENRLKTSEPLHSIYNRNIIPEIEKLIGEDVLHIKGLIEKIDTKFVLIDNKKIEKKEFRNLNRPEDI